MSLDHKTSEAFSPKPGNGMAEDNVVKFDRVFAVQGPRFQQFLQEVVMPTRQDVAVMVLQQLVAKASAEQLMFHRELMFKAFEMADDFCLTMPLTLDTKLNSYFDLYMKRGKIDDIIKASMDAAHDFSL